MGGYRFYGFFRWLDEQVAYSRSLQWVTRVLSALVLAGLVYSCVQMMREEQAEQAREDAQLWQQTEAVLRR